MVTLLRRLIRRRRAVPLDHALSEERAGFKEFLARCRRL
jgi:hypothetical protein